MKYFFPMTFALVLLALPGCGSSTTNACAKAEECATKAGTAFSQTECETKLTAAQEKADSVKCLAEFDDVQNCVSGLACGATSSEINANCGALAKTLSKCMGTSSSSSSSGGVGPEPADGCTLANDAIVAKRSSCPDYKPPTSGEDPPVPCTAAEGAVALCKSACLQETSSACLSLDTSQECSLDEAHALVGCFTACG
jgi:hypothetical protein